MAKRKGKPYKQKMIEALKELPNPIHDKRHGVLIYFIDDKARSNQGRFDHIVEGRHELMPSDIKRITKEINSSYMKMDKERSNTYNIYIKRNSYSHEYIKISLSLNFKESNAATVKTVFITKNFK